MTGPELRVITADDWEVFRALRLRALADAPDAFGITLAEAADNPESVWRERAQGPGPVVMAFEGERAVAMGGAHLPDGSPDVFVWSTSPRATTARGASTKHMAPWPRGSGNPCATAPTSASRPCGGACDRSRGQGQRLGMTSPTVHDVAIQPWTGTPLPFVP